MEGEDHRQKPNIPCRLLEYFQATPAVETAPIRPPTAPNFAASLAVFSWKKVFKNSSAPQHKKEKLGDHLLWFQGKLKGKQSTYATS